MAEIESDIGLSCVRIPAFHVATCYDGVMRDLRDVTEFYASRGGRVAARLLKRRLSAVWPDLSRLHVLGIGHAQPFLSLWEKQAALCVAAEFRAQGSTHLLASASCVVQESRLPLGDLGFDRILLCHALETSADAPRLLREVWRVLRDDGRLMLMVPNRRGLWAHAGRTPFGQGAASSKGEVERLLAKSLFRVERTVGALWMPPGNVRPLLRMGNLVEQAGSRVAPQVSGVLLIEAVKDVYAALPAGNRARRRVLAPVP